MQSSSRIQKSFYNLLSGFSYQIFAIITAFIVRTVFIRYLSTDYLGINGLYSNILSMLSLTELGFSTAMVYSMYKPLVEKDEVKLAQLMRFYKHIYTIIGVVVLVIGISLIPFLDMFIKDAPNVDHLTFYYVLFLLNSVMSYWFFAYRSSILQADQKTYIITNYQSVFNVIKTICQIIVLVLFRNFTIYLCTQILCNISQNIAVARRVKKDYPYILDSTSENLPKQERKKIFRDVRALMIQKLSFVTLNSSDNIIISSFVGVISVGVLSNFTMITDSVTAVISQVTSAITASLGNYFAQEDGESGYKLFCRVDFLNFWLYGFSMIALSILLDPFVTLWLGKKYTLGVFVTMVLGFRFFVEGYMRTMSTFRSTLGLFAYGQLLPLISTIVNIVLSIALSFVWGVAGVLIATPIARICVQVWYTTWLIHKEGFSKSVIPFVFKYIFRILLLSVVMLAMLFIVNSIFVKGINIVNFVFAVLVVAVFPNLIFVFAFFKTDEFKYFWNILKKRQMK